MTDPTYYMNIALSLAETAFAMDEVPVGAVVVKNGRIIGTGFNQRETLNVAEAHAEIIAMRRASQNLKSWRLVDCELYVTLEPCIMCAGALSQSRIRQVFYATEDPKTGALGSLYRVHADARLNHRFNVHCGHEQEKSQHLMKTFFRQKRELKKLQKSSDNQRTKQ